MYDSYKIFTPDDTEDEKPKRKVAFSNTNRFFFVDDDGNQERVDLRANLGDKVMGRCKATVCPVARPDGGCGISSPSPRWLEPPPPRGDGICYVCMYSSTYNAATYYQLYDAEVEVCLFSECLQLIVYFHKDIRIWRHMTIVLTQSSISIPSFFPPYQLLLRFCY